MSIQTSNDREVNDREVYERIVYVEESAQGRYL